MNLISEAYKKRLQQLAGINEAWGTGNTSEKEREDAFAKTNERVPYKKDLMIYAIKGGFEVGLLFKTKNEKDQMPIAKYRVVFPVAIGMNKKGNEVISAFHEIGQSESKARETGKRSAEAKNEWRLFKANNILSMWLTGKSFDKAPDGFKGSRDSRMTTVEAFFNPEEAKKIQAQQSADKTNKSNVRKDVVNRGREERPEPTKPIINKEPVKTKHIEKPVLKKEPIKKEPIKPEIKKEPVLAKKPIEKQPIEKKANTEPVKKPVNTKPIKDKEKDIQNYRNRRKRNYYPGEK